MRPSDNPCARCRVECHYQDNPLNCSFVQAWARGNPIRLSLINPDLVAKGRPERGLAPLVLKPKPLKQ